MTLYWDYNAAAPLHPRVAELLSRGLERQGVSFGNPSSVHGSGRAARNRLDAARARLGRALHCDPREVCFVSSGTEANALALKGAFASRKDAGRDRLVISAIEHPGLLFAAAQLEKTGRCRVTRVPPNEDGRVAAEAFVEALGPDVALASLQWVNNETGVAQPVDEVARACGDRGIPLHTDAVQAVGKLPLALDALNASLVSLSAHKLGGPAGIAALVVRDDLPLEALIPGHQEGGLRGGTPNVAAAEAFALAAELACAEQPAKVKRWRPLRERFEQAITARLACARVEGVGAPRVENTSLITFAETDGPSLLMALDLEGIHVSSGAACASGALTPSHVLLAMGLEPKRAGSAVRFSWGPEVTEAQVDRGVEALCRLVPRIAAFTG